MSQAEVYSIKCTVHTFSSLIRKKEKIKSTNNFKSKSYIHHMDVILCMNFFLLRICQLHTHTRARLRVKMVICDLFNELIFISYIFAMIYTLVCVDDVFLVLSKPIQSNIIIFRRGKWAWHDYGDDLGAHNFWTFDCVWFIHLLALKRSPRYVVCTIVHWKGETDFMPFVSMICRTQNTL